MNTWLFRLFLTDETAYLFRSHKAYRKDAADFTLHLLLFFHLDGQDDLW